VFSLFFRKKLGRIKFISEVSPRKKLKRTKNQKKKKTRKSSTN